MIPQHANMCFLTFDPVHRIKLLLYRIDSEYRGALLIVKLPEWLLFFVRQIMRYQGAFWLVLMLTAMITACSAFSPILAGRLIDSIALGDGPHLWQLVLLLLGIILAAEFIIILRNDVSRRVMIQLTHELTADSVASVLRTTTAFFARTSRGELLQRCIQDTRAIQQFGLFAIPGFMQDLVLACTAIIVISGIYWPVAVMIATLYLFLLIPLFYIGNKRGAARKKLAKQDARIRHSLLEKLESIKQIKIFGTEKREYEDYRKQQEAGAELAFQNGVLIDLYNGFSRIPDSMAPALTFLILGWQVVHGRATIGELLTVTAFIPAMIAPVRSFFTLYVTLAEIRVRLTGVLEYAKLPVEAGKAEGLLKPPHYREMALSLNNVSVGGDGDRGDLLRNITCRIEPGMHAAIVGPSGAGKSTLLHVLTRQLEPSEGTIYYGGYPLAQLDASQLRSRIGYMTQEGFLFHQTLLYNLTYFKEVEHEVLDHWMSALGAADIVNLLPQGYASIIGNSGTQLSGGQRQLVELVRTMVKDPDLLILDEATSALDPASEALVYHALQQYAGQVTRITVNHRLHSVKQADLILVMDHGEIVDQGTHEELLCNSSSLYARLWSSQLQGEQEIEASREVHDALYS
ncbi:ATM1-type heavy metal exporter [Paenibacillus plantiphilus]|uniref:ATM1-type heavy metal exporter n=1 Tax=Paenibacillus plantiphilus TaxID=2905650 RepID=A0ABM9C2V7_9BACL|nr:ATM1-type heavy metal exporter [Paenibacillus plantiphilus]